MASKKEVKLEPGDKLVAMEMQTWSVEKHERLKRYLIATYRVRKKFTNGPGGSAYIDVYCGTGRGFLKGTNTFVDGSPIVAQRAAMETGVPFTHFIINDFEKEYVNACATRLKRLGVKPHVSAGKAEDNISSIVQNIPKFGFVVAFVDPYNLVPFRVLEALSKINHMDILIHVSVLELQRNLDKYFGDQDSPLEAFAPGITGVLKQGGKQQMRNAVFEYWKSKFADLNMSIGKRVELITGSKNQPLYYLVIASHEKLADKIWEDVAKIDPQKEFVLNR